MARATNCWSCGVELQKIRNEGYREFCGNCDAELNRLDRSLPPDAMPPATAARPPTAPATSAAPKPKAADPVFTLHGPGGQLEVYPDKVRIRRKGVLAKGLQGFFAGERDIYYNTLGSVLTKQAGRVTNGYIQFFPAGSVDSRNKLLKATRDENTVFFSRNQNELVRQIQAYIDTQQRRPAMAQPAMPATPPDQSQADRLDALERLARLRADGTLTDAEFTAQKLALLGRIP